MSIRSFFSFTKRTADLGVGTGDLGFQQFQTLPPGGSYLGGTGPRDWNIQRSLGPLNAPGFMILNGAAVPVTLRGSGLGLSGQYVLQPLAANQSSTS